MGRRAWGILKDYPLVVSGLLGTGVAAHRVLYDVVHVFPDVPGEMASFDQAWSIYLGFAGVVAITAGFTGVVVVFALSSTSDRFVRLRHLAGARLEANWVSPITTALTAAFGSVGCAVLAGIDHGLLAWWFFELFFLITAASAIRLIWIFRSMVRIAREDDITRYAHIQAPTSLHDLQTRRKHGA